jgi:glycine cleavage system P protein (glycine dehydrogenase)
MTSTTSASQNRAKNFSAPDRFTDRHLDSDAAMGAILRTVGASSLEELVTQTIPDHIRAAHSLELPPTLTEDQALQELRRYCEEIRVGRSFLGMGYHPTRMPQVILRNILENPAWYTQYTPYQAEISQGRLEALLNYQTMVCELTGLPLSNSSLLDEATAAAEAMVMCWGKHRRKRPRFLVADHCHPQTIAVLRTRATGLGIEVAEQPLEELSLDDSEAFGILLQLPTTDGALFDLEGCAQRAHAAGIQVVVATDPMALVLMRSPGSMGADIALGSSQRFGVPMGFGGPHAAFLACTADYQRLIPGRVVGITRDAAGAPALRLAMQTREQHIRRDKATSNICTAQVLLAVLASMYAIYHGPAGLQRIAGRIHRATIALAAGLRRRRHMLRHDYCFDTLRINAASLDSETIRERAKSRHFYLREFENGDWGISLDETVEEHELVALLEIFDASTVELASDLTDASAALDEQWRREEAVLNHTIFDTYHTEHEFLRYLHRLQSRELSLTTSMIPLGSCTMKLNPTTGMIPVTWPEFSQIHPFAPDEDTVGYRRMIDDLESYLAEISGFDRVSLQPNAGAQGEYAGLLVIRAYHASQGEGQRDVCLVPTSAHGTNPASSVLAGLKVVPVACDARGNIDVEDLRTKAAQHAERLAALMITYPSTHGVFETSVREICAAVHENGGQVYLDGANMNAQVGLARPGDYGADVCHLNLHKTFAIPHGGGGPGMGPIGVASHLVAFLPTHPIVDCGGDESTSTVSAAPWGSPSILPISWSYIRMLGAAGLARASAVAILNANYMAAQLRNHYDILYTGENGRVAHEFILDVRPFEASASVSVDDFAKRLMDYGFHAPTMSWPVAGTLMIEPTESESKDELDRFCAAMISIRNEIRAIEEGRADREDNVLRNAPHTVREVTKSEWTHPYSREEAAYPVDRLRDFKFWPAVARVDNAYGDRHLVCTCPPMEAYSTE